MSQQSYRVNQTTEDFEYHKSLSDELISAVDNDPLDGVYDCTFDYSVSAMSMCLHVSPCVSLSR